MGIGGAAIATLAAQLVQTTLLAIVVQRKRAKAGEGRGHGPRSGWAADFKSASLTFLVSMAFFRARTASSW